MRDLRKYVIQLTCCRCHATYTIAEMVGMSGDFERREEQIMCRAKVDKSSSGICGEVAFIAKKIETL